VESECYSTDNEALTELLTTFTADAIQTGTPTTSTTTSPFLEKMSGRIDTMPVTVILTL